MGPHVYETTQETPASMSGLLQQFDIAFRRQVRPQRWRVKNGDGPWTSRWIWEIITVACGWYVQFNLPPRILYRLTTEHKTCVEPAATQGCGRASFQQPKLHLILNGGQYYIELIFGWVPEVLNSAPRFTQLCELLCEQYWHVSSVKRSVSGHYPPAMASNGQQQVDRVCGRKLTSR